MQRDAIGHFKYLSFIGIVKLAIDANAILLLFHMMAPISPSELFERSIFAFPLLRDFQTAALVFAEE